MIIPLGTIVPDFKLKSTENTFISLIDLKGKPAILVFYPGDNTPVCTNQLSLYNEIQTQGLFNDYNAQIIGISVNDIHSHYLFVKNLGLTFPLLADDDPLGRVTKAFGVFNEKSQQSERALFVLNAEGKIHWSYVAPINVNPGAEGIFQALDSL